MEILPRDAHHVREAQAGIAAEQEHVQAAAESFPPLHVQRLQAAQLLGGQMRALGFLMLDAVFPERVSRYVEQLHVDRLVDIPLELLHVLGDGVLVVTALRQEALEPAQEVVVDILEMDFRLVLRQEPQRR